MQRKPFIKDDKINDFIKGAKDQTSLSIGNVINDGKKEPQIEYIDIDKMIPNEENEMYDMEGKEGIHTFTIEGLADNIRDTNLAHPINLRPLPDGTYRIIAGHRRRLALKLNYERYGEERYKLPMCLIRYDIDNDLDEWLALHRNAADDRIENTMLIAKRAKKTEELIKLKKARGDKVEGEVRELVGKELKMSGKQASRYIEMAEKLIPEMQELIEKNIISGSAALEFKKRSEEEQGVIVAEIKKAHDLGIELTRDQAKKLNEDYLFLKGNFDKLKEELDQANEVTEQIKTERSELQTKIDNMNTEKDKLNDRIKELEKSADKTALEEAINKAKELEEERDRLISENDEIVKALQKQVDNKEKEKKGDDKKDLINSKDFENIKNNLLINHLVSAGMDTVLRLNNELQLYFEDESFKVSEQNTDLLSKFLKSVEMLKNFL